MFKRFFLVALVGAFSLALQAGTAFAAAPTFSTTPPAVTNGQTQTFEFDYAGATAFACKLDGATATSCASPHTLTGLAEGPHTFEVTAAWTEMTVICIPMTPGPPLCNPFPIPKFSDPVSFSFTIDRSGPATVITSGPKQFSARRTTKATFHFTSEAGALTSCKLDKLTAISCGAAITFKKLKPGVHRLVASSTDSIGNVGPSKTVIFATNSKRLRYSFASGGKKVKRCARSAKGKWRCKKLKV
jgi:hypothetical protein